METDSSSGRELVGVWRDDGADRVVAGIAADSVGRVVVEVVTGVIGGVVLGAFSAAEVSGVVGGVLDDVSGVVLEVRVGVCLLDKTKTVEASGVDSVVSCR